MKIGHVLFALIFIILLTACSGPIVIPANVQVTLPPNQNFIISATVPATAGPSETPGPTATTEPTATFTLAPTLTFTPTPTSTWTPVPTRKSPYPVSQATPIIDLGFQAIHPDNLPQLKLVYSALEPTRRHAAVSADGTKLFLATSTGLFLFDRAGEMLAHWSHIFTADIPCESCISVNRDGSRVAVMTRNAGKWEAQVYDVNGNLATLILALPVDYAFQRARNEASIAISPDDAYLAFSAGAVGLRVLDLETKLPALTYTRPVDGISFTPDGAYFVIHGGREILFYDTQTWKRPTNNLLLPREDTPYVISPNGKLLAIALPTKMRVYEIETLRPTREINVPPSNADTRQWQIVFEDDKTLGGYAIRWQDSFQTRATVDSGQWDLETGKTLRLETVTSSSPDALASLWGADLPLASNKGDLELGIQAYNTFRFVSDWMLLVNTPHSACWSKLDTGEITCFKDPEHILFATDGNVLKEVVGQYETSLQDRSGAVVIQVGTYRFETINRTGEWALINSGKGTNLYTKGKKLPQESVKGLLQGFSENAGLIVISTLEKENTFYLTIIDKASGNTIFQKKTNFLYKPILMTADGTVYYLQRDLDKNLTIINVIDPKTYKVRELTRLSLPAEPKVLTLSAAGLFAIGQKDGSVLVMTQDTSLTSSFQAATSAIGGLSFNPSGKFLAVASEEGVRVFAVLP
jgi:WD40 repeat protein